MAIQPIPFVPLLLLTFLLELRMGVTISNCKANERNALLNFKKYLIDKRNRLVSWNGEDCCKWKGISCNNLTGHVVRLDLRNPYHLSNPDFTLYNEWLLRGQLSSSLLCLKQLNYLDLSRNLFDGPIPKFIGSLRNLRYLNLSLAGFHGLIPNHLGNLSRLEYLDLNNGWNDYRNTSITDDSHWLSCLTSLKHLTMKNTYFKSFQNSMEALNKLPNIAKLSISFCNISDFPVSLPYVNFTNLSYLDLSDNDISQGSIPSWLFDIKSLTHIDLKINKFSSIPDALKNLTSLQYIDFSANGFSGALPQAFKNLCKLHTLRFLDAFTQVNMHEFREMFSGCLKDSIENLDLSSNALNAYLPDWFGEMHKMKTLDLSNNLLFGSIPESFGYLVDLEELLLLHNKLNGTVPKSIGQLANLLVLDLRENSLEGVMSEVHFTRLARLNWLDLGSNNLILNVNHDWIPPFKLHAIDMGSSKIGPHFPKWLQTQVNLSFLNLSSSGIVDILPDWFCDVFVTHDVNNIWLDLSNNGITGNLPPLSKLSFSYFDLSSNFFKGPLPTSLNLSEYSVFFDVSNNSFSGSIPPILGNKTGAFLNLSRNNFSGEIPLSICLANAEVIDLSWNLLTGELPNCWHLHQLIYGPVLLDFSGNNLSGNIPSSLGTLADLESLHLSHNNFSGSLPMALRNCVDLITLELGMNNLTGKIPTWVGEDLIHLKVLVLRSNNLMGNVPSNLSKLKKLRTLDLANNKLVGVIPRSFGNFRDMMDMHSDDEDIDSLIITTVNFNRLMDYAQLTVKNQDWIYDKLLSQITIIDLSLNNLSERIPKELGNLHGLINLNLSGNHFVGSIPDAIGLMHSLESLDLSRNELSGNIPSTMSTMTTLNSLDLSYNNLSGKIPSGPQLQTFSNESYIGNPKLCGFPLTQSCDSNKTSNVEVSVDEVTESDYWYVSIAPGFVLGVCIVWGAFLVKKKWKNAYFRYVDHVYDAIYVFLAVNINKFKRKIGNETTLD